MVLLFMLIGLPSFLYLPAIAVLCFCEISYTFKPTKLLSSYFVCGSWGFIYIVNIMLSWQFANPFVLFESNIKEISIFCLPFLTLF